jgi:hypothetical protein
MGEVNNSKPGEMQSALHMQYFERLQTVLASPLARGPAWLPANKDQGTSHLSTV